MLTSANSKGIEASNEITRRLPVAFVSSQPLSTREVVLPPTVLQVRYDNLYSTHHQQQRLIYYTTIEMLPYVAVLLSHPVGEHRWRTHFIVCIKEETWLSLWQQHVASKIIIIFRPRYLIFQGRKTVPCTEKNTKTRKDCWRISYKE